MADIRCGIPEMYIHRPNFIDRHVTAVYYRFFFLKKINYCFIKGYVTCNRRKNEDGVPSHYGTDILEYPNIKKKKKVH